jgi:predicted O-linked N-acetylglucosamine transferase (SPINDLY family)
VKRNLSAAATSAGINPDRLVFATRVPRVEDHLARYRHASVFLDTHPYNGHTTVSDALYAGLPVVTLRGQSFASRVATSLLTDLGLEDWSTDNLASYKQIALHLVSSEAARDRLARAKQEKGWPFPEAEQARALAEILLDTAS